MSKTTRQLILELDDQDYDAVQGYIADFQSKSRNIDPDGPTILPDGESNLAGAIIAECVRDLLEYRQLWQVEHPDQ